MRRSESPAISPGELDLAGRVVVRVDGQGAGARRDGRFYGGLVHFETVIGIDDYGHAVVVVDVIDILEEVGARVMTSSLGLRMVLRTTLAAAASQVMVISLAAKGRPNPWVRVLGHGIVGVHAAGVAHITVHPGHGLAGEAAQLVLELGGRFDDGVAEGQVKDILGPNLGLEGNTLLKDPTNSATFRHEPLNLL